MPRASRTPCHSAGLIQTITQHGIRDSIYIMMSMPVACAKESCAYRKAAEKSLTQWKHSRDYDTYTFLSESINISVTSEDWFERARGRAAVPRTVTSLFRV